MYQFTGESLDIEQLRERLRRMSDDELVRFGEAAGYMCSPKANLNKPAPPIFVLQLDEAQAEWRRRNPRPSASATEIPLNFGPKLETDTGKNGVSGS